LKIGLNEPPRPQFKTATALQSSRGRAPQLADYP
jgi:hypothetical protein